MENIGILGLGTVGTGVVELLESNGDLIAQKLGRQINVKKILVRDLSRARTPLARGKITARAEDILEDEEIKIVVELMGGEEPALSFIMRALENKKHVVTANKEVISKYGGQLLEMAGRVGVNLLFEASVGGGIPIIRPMKQCLAANNIYKISAILNGTTNYILTQMEETNKDFEEALREAQIHGYAESDPSADIKGLDAARKLAILSSIAFNTRVTPDKIYTQGIDGIELSDIKYARELGYTIKLVATGRRLGRSVELLVSPVMLRYDHPLSSVRDVFNAVLLEGDAVGRVMFYGRGAGKMPTASAVIADIMDAVRNDSGGRMYCTCYNELDVLDRGAAVSRFYIRLKAQDRPGVLAEISGALGKNNISLSMVIQKDVKNRVAEIVLVTYEVPLKDLERALDEIKEYDQVVEIANVIRVEEGVI
ncbi:homoserine dehydrogenase [Thermosediminibacter litoriperuensis]|uniref:Homoserine dehydrogenase n=1 Tax=Thermosediminibacter litoriperuensis TaxID=291989 RepID=A0A5S5ATA4_9FIRM|nr:homoserine dehydrogenase [Thermosediminibacter litoriperuensis]TYP54912.1 homoserine dehydrogenase [Thermosediminibacter litoriperuensis]